MGTNGSVRFNLNKPAFVHEVRIVNRCDNDQDAERLTGTAVYVYDEAGPQLCGNVTETGKCKTARISCLGRKIWSTSIELVGFCLNIVEVEASGVERDG